MLLQRYRAELERVEEELAARDTEMVERAAEEWDALVLSRLGDCDMRSIAAVSDAMARIDAGTYGRCLDCNEMIARARLEAVPETSRCLDCSTENRQPAARSA